MGLDYAAEKCSAAVSSLATGTGSLKERLYDAFVSGIARVNSFDLPESLRGEFDVMWEKATSGQPKHDEGSILATLNAMTEEELQNLAGQIVLLGFDVAEAYGSSLVEE